LYINSQLSTCVGTQSPKYIEMAQGHISLSLLPRNMLPNFARALNTPSEVSEVLAQIANGMPRTPDAESYRQILTQEANHLLPLAHPPNEMCHAINSRRDA
jgi:hypothetical protein